MMMPAKDEAHALAQSGRGAEALAQLRAAGEQGDAAAAMQAAVWQLTGEFTPRDLPGARAALRWAVTAGHIDAAAMQIALTANGAGAPADWGRAGALLRVLARTQATAQQQLALLDAMPIDASGMPTQPFTAEPLSDSPRVSRCVQLFTPAERSYVARLAHPLLEPAVVADPQTGRMIQHPVRTSMGAVIGPTREDLVISALNRRIAAASGLPYDHGEPLAVLAYRSGQEYKPHFDGLPNTANQRARTVLIYLNDGYDGGETLFMANGLKVAPRAGDAIIFENVTADGAVDPRSQHAGLPVTRGVKWLATRWIRQRPYDPWNPS